MRFFTQKIATEIFLGYGTTTHCSRHEIVSKCMFSYSSKYLLEIDIERWPVLEAVNRSTQTHANCYSKYTSISSSKI